MLKDIEKHIELINNSISWAKKFNEETFPIEVFKEYRRKLKKIYTSLEEKCSAAAYGESQVGKSYLISSLLSSPDSPFVIVNGDKSYSFIDELNPSGGKNSKVESTGVITRFTICNEEERKNGLVKVKNLSVVDIILLLTDSYYNDVNINPDNVLKYDDINKELDKIVQDVDTTGVQQTEIEEDDIKDINDYIREIIGNPAVNIYKSNFCKSIAPVIKYIPYDKWVDIFSLMWNKNQDINHLFCYLINEYKKIDFQKDIYVPFRAVLRDKGTLLKIDWLKSVCGEAINTDGDELYTEIYNKEGVKIQDNFPKSSLSSIIAELTFELPSTIANNRSFLNKIDLLDFPGARSREVFNEDSIHSVLSSILTRGKVAYLFNKYSRSLRISSVLFCHHNDMKGAPSVGSTISNWIESNIAKTPEERTEVLNNTNGISPLFFVATKFNIDLARTKTDNPANTEKLTEHWQRFNNTYPEIIKPSEWFDNWVVPGRLFRSSAFQSIYPLRDFYWSKENRIFDGYSDGINKSEEQKLHVDPDYPDYFANLKRSFLNNDFVQKHFSDPEKTWDSVATLNNDGSKTIIADLNAISKDLEDARRRRYLKMLNKIKQDMYNTLSVFFVPEDQESKNAKVKQIASDIRISLILNVGSKPEIFGRIIDSLMVPAGDLRDIAYNVIVCHKETPKEFSLVNFIREQADINPLDDKDVNIKKICDFFTCDIDKINQKLEEHECTVEDIISSDSTTLTTVADVVVKNITDYWNEYLNEKVKILEPILPHSKDVVFMLTSLLKKLDIRTVMSEKIDKYCKLFDPKEQPNVIADYASLTLNNFVSSVGRRYLDDSDISDIKDKAERCNIKIDTDAFEISRKPRPLIQTLNAFDAAYKIDKVDKNTLMQLPLWNNFQLWENSVIMGLLFTSDISQVDPVANAKMKDLIANCNVLYKNIGK